jgi:O-antigen ligase
MVLTSIDFDLIEANKLIFGEEGIIFLRKNYLAVLFSFVIIILSSLLYSKQQMKYHGYFIVLISLFSISLIVTNSRAAILCLLISVFFLFYWFNKKLFFVSLFSVLSLFLLLYISPFWDGLIFLMRIEDIGTGRDYLLETAVAIIKENFWLGAGPAGTKHLMYNHLPFMLNTPAEWVVLKNYNTTEFGQAHNFYIFYFSDLGIGGFLVSLIFPIFFFNLCKKVMQVIKKNKTTNDWDTYFWYFYLFKRCF